MNFRALFAVIIAFQSVAAVAGDPIVLPADTPSIHYVPESITASDGVVLTGQLAVLKTEGVQKFPAVLLLSGSGPLDRYETIPASDTATGAFAPNYQPLETFLVSQGIAVFSYDKRGIHPVDATFSSDRVDQQVWMTSTAMQLESDAQKAFDLMLASPWIDPDRVAIVAHSEGTALATELVESGRSVKGLFQLGIFTRPFSDLMKFQFVDSSLRVFDALDVNQDGDLSEAEIAPMHQADPTLFADNWNAFYSFYDGTSVGEVSRSEFESKLIQLNSLVDAAIETGTSPTVLGLPRLWWKQYFDAEPFLGRDAKLCSKIHVFQGEIDMQTPFADAVALRDLCASNQTPLASFHGYAGVGHGFSPRIGFKDWEDTDGPMEPSMLSDVANEVAGLLRF